MDVSQLESLLTPKQVAEAFGVEVRIVRREGRKGRIPGMLQILGRMGFLPEDVLAWVPPEAPAYSAKSARDDGRSRYIVYLLPEEFRALLAEGKEVIDPRVKQAERRAARKAAEANDGSGEKAEPEAPEDTDSPFEDFNL